MQIAKDTLPADIAIQIPPNLILSDSTLLDCIVAGAQDLGGIGPIDEVNPDYGHRDRQTTEALLATQGQTLRKRLHIYPQYNDWLSNPLQSAVRKRQAI